MTKDKSKLDKEDLEAKEAVTPENDTVEEVNATEEKVEDLKTEEEKKADEIEALRNQLNETNDKYMRLSAEFDNYRKRTLKEKMELTKSAGEKILLNVLPVMDNFERALKSVDESNDIKGVKEGIHLIYTNFKDFMIQQGVKEIEATNQAFDTDLHEAITKIPAPSKKLKGKVVDCVEKGYFLNDKVIRFSKVVVGE
ncbi:nucleotide exchange factor GrpE [Ancylomarina euxinus]|uniref:Protein GrpE n=1 Tax=Ancylomarina euxinus TaxID=2283627 RepID=A0A425Y351_9BACT|nr:nucleotide exchange factor GrpE [Ancylomarina euxinus]MCZ4693140.1 nucleotide exchange factor GrpE [Ancylomarina euxinus]MUP15278.1 nucleotide exchange factor GrpE [Ancylomarina euxinus]RRG22592.1 nucleotide exchange factor GrpE [Ancylomarina euxinus]